MIWCNICRREDVINHTGEMQLGLSSFPLLKSTQIYHYMGDPLSISLGSVSMAFLEYRSGYDLTYATPGVFR